MYDVHVALPSRVISLLIFFALSSATGCGDDTSTPDGGAGDAAPDGTAPDAAAPAAPEAPIPPNFGPCPEGWRSVPTGEGFDVCEPFPASGRPTCGRDEAFFPGAEACTPIGTVCPSGDFPVDLPADAPVFYVLAGATSGDGTEASPYGTIGEATAVAAAGATIAVGKGTYSEAVSVPAGVTLHGACVAETLLTFDAETYTVGVVEAAGADVTIRNLRVGDSARPCITVVGAGRSATVEDVVVHNCYAAGISVEMGASLTGRRIVTRDHRIIESFGSGGRGLASETGSQVDVRWLHAEGCREFSVVAYDAEMTLEDATILETSLPTPSAAFSLGVMVTNGARFTGRRIVIDEATTVGVIVQNASSTAAFEDLVIRRTRPGGLFGWAHAIEANDHADASCTRCLFEDLLELGAGANANSAMRLTDTMIRRVGPRAADDRSGRALSVQNGGALTVDRVVAVDLFEHGVVVDGATSELRGNDLVLRRIESDMALGQLGRGITLQGESTTVLERLEVGVVREAALVLGESVSATLTDLHVHDVSPRVLDGIAGRGVSVQSGTTLTLTRARVERVIELGLAAIGSGTSITATDLVVSDVTPQDCDDPLCSTDPGGHGIGSYLGAQVMATRFAVSNASLCGVQIADEATMSLADGEVRGAPIGACLQSDAQDVGDLQQGVRYVDNDSNIEATTLPVPAPLGSVE